MKGLIGYIAGLFSGMMIIEGLMVFFGRNGAPGGEILILLLIGILIAFGFQMGRDSGYMKGCSNGFDEGYKEGYNEGSQERKVKLVVATTDADDGHTYDQTIRLPLASGK